MGSSIYSHFNLFLFDPRNLWTLSSNQKEERNERERKLLRKRQTEQSKRSLKFFILKIVTNNINFRSLSSSIEINLIAAMPQPKTSKRSIKETKTKQSRLRIRSDSEINRLSNIAPDKENGSAIIKEEVIKRTKDNSVEKEIEKPLPKEDKSLEAAIQFMTHGPKVDDVDYWRKVAEECREALSKTLEENERLCDEMDLLKAENEQLRQIIENVVAQDAIIP